MTTHDTYNSWPIKIYTTCIRSGSDGEPATYNSYAYCLCNADGSAGTMPTSHAAAQTAVGRKDPSPCRLRAAHRKNRSNGSGPDTRA